MSTALILLFLLFAAAAFTLLIIFAIKKLRKKDTKAGKFSLFSLIAAMVCLFAFIGFKDPSSCFVIAGFLLGIAAFVLLVRAVILGIRKKDRPRSWISFAVTAALCAAMIFCSTASWNAKMSNPENYEVKIKTDYDFEVVDGDTPIEVLTSKGFESASGFQSTYRTVFDSCDIHLLLKKTSVTKADCLKAVKNNKNLGKKYKEFFCDFIERICEQYPDADLSTLYHNLKGLKLEELSKIDYVAKSWSSDSYGCYNFAENTIYIPEGTEYIEGEWGFQVLIHEFCHVLRTSRWDSSDGKFVNKIEFNDAGDHRTLLMEAMNSVFSCSLLNYDEKDIAYQVPSNYLRIMLECIDNYSLTDYVNHGDTYFLQKLDEATGYTNYADVMWKLICVQRSDYQDDSLNLSADKYYPIYDYLCDMYYGKYITPGMTHEQCLAVADELVEKAFFDAPEEYNIDKDYFYTYLEEYLSDAAA